MVRVSKINRHSTARSAQKVEASSDEDSPTSIKKGLIRYDYSGPTNDMALGPLGRKSTPYRHAMAFAHIWCIQGRKAQMQEESVDS